MCDYLDDITPPGTYHLFKFCLLLSLVMEGDESSLNVEEKESKNKQNHLHVLVEDDDVLLYQRMMMFAGSLTESLVIHRVAMDLFGAVNDVDSLVYVDGEISL